VIEGIYTYDQHGLPPATWTIFPICVNTIGDLREPLYLPVACTLKITSAAWHLRTHTSTHDAVCGVPPSMTKTPFTLSYEHPLPIPVERYPLVCVPAGLRHCR
jgi:hypothetical protein